MTCKGSKNNFYIYILPTEDFQTSILRFKNNILVLRKITNYSVDPSKNFLTLGLVKRGVYKVVYLNKIFQTLSTTLL